MSEKREFKKPKNLLGYVSKSQNGNVIITVEQDMVLKKGDKLIQKRPADVLDGLAEAGIITEEECESRKSKVPEWKLYEVSRLVFKD